MGVVAGNPQDLTRFEGVAVTPLSEARREAAGSAVRLR